MNLDPNIRAPRFRRFGRSYQLRVEQAGDLRTVVALDESLWAATSAPTGAFRCDARFLECLDSDNSGRITSDEVKAASRWLCNVLEDMSGVSDESETVRLAALRTAEPDGARLMTSARYVLTMLGDDDGTELSLERLREFLASVKAQPLNGDGVLAPSPEIDDVVREFLEDAVACVGGVRDAGGARGVTAVQAEAFQAAVIGHLAWREQALPGDNGRTLSVLPFGEDTPDLYALLREHAPRVEYFFALCRALRFEPRAGERLNALDAGFRDFVPWDSEELEPRLKRLPLAVPNSEGRLPLFSDALNPAYSDGMGELSRRVIERFADAPVDVLEEASWDRIVEKFRPYGDYLAACRGAEVSHLPLDALRKYAAGEAIARARKLFEEDERVAAVLKGVWDLEKALLYQAGLLRFLNNFVNFRQLYETRESALFEMGAGVIDGRWFNLALPVDDVAAHSAVARGSGLYILYIDVAGTGESRPKKLALPATSGAKGNLGVGKRGVFFDIDGRECDARIIQIIDHPISFREALLAPFARLWDFVVGKIEMISAASEKQLQQNVDASLPVSGTPGAPSPQPAAPAAAAARASPFGGPAGMFVGLSVSFAAVGSALAFITRTLGTMRPVEILTGLLGAIAALLLPLTLVALAKLWRQDLSGLLEASGWAVNARMRLTLAQRRQFTRKAPYPPHAEGIPARRWLWRALILAFILAALSYWLGQLR